MANAMMKVGGVGSILWLASVIIVLSVAVLIPGMGLSSLQTMVYALMGAIIVMGIGILFVSIGSFGLWRKYANAMPLVGGIMGLLSALMLLSTMAITIAAPELLTVGGIMGWVSLIAGILLSVFLVMLGVSFVMFRSHMGTEMALPAGILCLLGGAGAANVDVNALLSGSMTGVLAGITGALVGLFAMLIVVTWVFFKGK